MAHYDTIRLAQVLQSLNKDPGLKAIVEQGLKHLQEERRELEKLLAKYAIPMPKRPPAEVVNLDIIDDEYVFRRIFRGIQGFIPIHAQAMVQTARGEADLQAFCSTAS